MNYYIIDNKIIEFNEVLDEKFYNFPKLSNEEAIFYEQNRNASIPEILNLALNVEDEQSLEDWKEMLIKEISDLAFEKRQEVLKDYKIANASIGIYDEAETEKIKNIILDFRNTFYLYKKEIEEYTKKELQFDIYDIYENIIEKWS